MEFNIEDKRITIAVGILVAVVIVVLLMVSGPAEYTATQTIGLQLPFDLPSTKTLVQMASTLAKSLIGCNF